MESFMKIVLGERLKTIWDKEKIVVPTLSAFSAMFSKAFSFRVDKFKILSLSLSVTQIHFFFPRKIENLFYRVTIIHYMFKRPIKEWKYYPMIFMR